jgi:hypothetical protein
MQKRHFHLTLLYMSQFILPSTLYILPRSCDIIQLHNIRNPPSYFTISAILQIYETLHQESNAKIFHLSKTNLFLSHLKTLYTSNLHESNIHDAKQSIIYHLFVQLTTLVFLLYFQFQVMFFSQRYKS